MSAVTETPIRVGNTWAQVNVPAGDAKPLIRIIEITGPPTLSSPVNYRVVRNDAHPHRVGKHSSIRSSELRRKYRAVAG